MFLTDPRPYNKNLGQVHLKCTGLKLLQVFYNEEKSFARLSIDQKPTVVNAGFIWNEESRRWEGSRRAAYRLINFIDEKNRHELLKDLDLIPKAVPQVRFPKHRLTPYAHQLEGVRWVLSRRASYLAFEAGTGKSAVLPMCMNTIDGPAIVVCPSFLKLNWEDELEKWLIDFHHIQILKKQNDILDPSADVYIVPDSLLHVHEFRQQFFKLSRRFKYLVSDESHRFKSEDARRTMSFVGKREVKIGRGRKALRVSWKGFHHIADHVVSLSGTPMPNRPIELFPLISRHAPHAVNFYDKHRFGVRYCGGFESDWGWDYTGASNLNELNRVLTLNYMLIRKKKDCLDLPEKLPPRVIYIDDDRGNLRKEEMKLLSKLKVTDLIAYEMKRNAAFKRRVEDKLEDNPEMGGFGFISELRRMLGQSKIKAAISVIKELLEDRDKIIVFVWHQEVADKLCEGLKEFNPLKVTGKIKNEKRHENVKKFQSDNKHRLIILNIQAGGVGITLTKSSLVVFVERSWVPADNDQAVDRADRIGQTESVETVSLIVKNSLDHLILNAHMNKNVIIQATIKSQE